jgi:hypothetical protein
LKVSFTLFERLLFIQNSVEHAILLLWVNKMLITWNVEKYPKFSEFGFFGFWVLGPFNVLVYSMDSQTSGSSWKRVCDAFWLPTDCLHTRLGSGYKLFNVFLFASLTFTCHLEMTTKQVLWCVVSPNMRDTYVLRFSIQRQAFHMCL